MDPSCLVSTVGWWWCNGVGNIFLAHTGPLNTNWELFKCCSLPEDCWPRASLYGHSQPTPKHTPSSNWFHKHDNEFSVLPMAFPVSRYQSNRAPWGCGGRGDLQHDRAAISLWFVMLLCHQGPESLEDCFQHLVESMQQHFQAVLGAKRNHILH